MFVPGLFHAGPRVGLGVTNAVECLEAVGTGSIVHQGADFFKILISLLNSLVTFTLLQVALLLLILNGQKK